MFTVSPGHMFIPQSGETGRANCSKLPGHSHFYFKCLYTSERQIKTSPSRSKFVTQNMDWLKKKENGFTSTCRGPACAVAGPPRRKNILSTGSFPLPPHSSTHVSFPPSPRNERSLRGLDRVSGTAMAD